jgi:hypothetical protein
MRVRVTQLGGEHAPVARYCGGEVVSINGTTLVARRAPTNSGGELLMRHVLKDPAVIPETVAWS